MSSFTLDDIRTAAEAKYGNLDIPLDSEGNVVTLRNPLRLSKKERDALQEFQEKMGEEDADQEALLGDALRLVSVAKAQVDKLLRALDGDLTQLVTVFEMYGELNQVGEASPSQD